MSFESLFKLYQSFIKLEKGLSENSQEAYRRDLRHYLNYLSDYVGIQDLNQVDIRVLEGYLETLRDLGLASSSMARRISSIRGFHGYCVMEQITETNPAELLELPNKGFQLPEVLPLEDILRMIEVHDPGTPVGLRSRAILELLYATGIRVSELCHLSLDRLFFEIGFIRVIGKGNKERIVPVGEYAIKAVNNWLASGRPFMLKELSKAEGAVFINQRGTPLSRMSVWTLVAESAKSAHIHTEVYPHIFRHSCATHLLEGGADLRTVQEFLGHASILTTEIYTHVDRTLLQQTHKMYHPRA